MCTDSRSIEILTNLTKHGNQANLFPVNNKYDIMYHIIYAESSTYIKTGSKSSYTTRTRISLSTVILVHTICTIHQDFLCDPAQ